MLYLLVVSTPCLFYTIVDLLVLCMTGMDDTHLTLCVFIFYYFMHDQFTAFFCIFHLPSLHLNQINYSLPGVSHLILTPEHMTYCMQQVSLLLSRTGISNYLSNLFYSLLETAWLKVLHTYVS